MSTTYRGIRDEFNDQYISHFFTPIIYNNGEVLETSDNLLNCYCNDSASDSAALRSTFPICGEYELWFKFRVRATSGDPDFFVIYDTSTKPKPDAIATLDDTMKIRCWWDTSHADLELQYYDTSNIIQTIALDINSVLDIWYYVYLSKNGTNYTITIFDSDMIVLSGPTSVAISSVNNGENPDYLVWGTLANATQQIDMELDFVDIKFDILATNYSNNKHHFNSDMKSLTKLFYGRINDIKYVDDNKLDISCLGWKRKLKDIIIEGLFSQNAYGSAYNVMNFFASNYLTSFNSSRIHDDAINIDSVAFGTTTAIDTIENLSSHSDSIYTIDENKNIFFRERIKCPYSSFIFENDNIIKNDMEKDNLFFNYVDISFSSSFNANIISCPHNNTKHSETCSDGDDEIRFALKFNSADFTHISRIEIPVLKYVDYGSGNVAHVWIETDAAGSPSGTTVAADGDWDLAVNYGAGNPTIYPTTSLSYFSQDAEDYGYNLIQHSYSTPVSVSSGTDYWAIIQIHGESAFGNRWNLYLYETDESNTTKSNLYDADNGAGTWEGWLAENDCSFLVYGAQEINVSGYAVDEDSIELYGEQKIKLVDSAMRSNIACEEKANRILQKKSVPEYTGKLKILPFFRLRLPSFFTINDYKKGLNYENILIQSIKYTLSSCEITPQKNILGNVEEISSIRKQVNSGKTVIS